jgi:hypothetical protein
MKIFPRSGLAAATALLTLVGGLRAQTASTPATPVAPALATSGTPAPTAPTPATTKFYGWIDTGITLNSTRPNDRQNFGRLFDNAADELLLNQLAVTAERDFGSDASKFAWGFKAQAIYGSDARFIHGLGLLDNASNMRNQPDIPELYLNLHFPVLSGGSLDVKAGKFVTLEGAETIDPRSNIFYSHTYIFNFGIPFQHTGVLATLHASDTFDLMAGITRGVNTALTDNNGAVSFHGGIGFNKLLGGKITGLLSVHIGPETPHDSKDLRYLDDLTFTYTISDKQSLIVDLNYAQDDAAKVSGQGAAIYFQQTVSDTVSVALRGEVWRDSEGFFVAQIAANDDAMNFLTGYPNLNARTVGGGVTTYGALTLGANIKVPSVSKPFAGLVIRPEVRYDKSLNNTTPFIDSSHKNQFTFGVDAVLTF